MRRIKTALLFGLFLTMLPAAQAADVTITVNGRVVAKPCTVSTPSAVVDLGDLYTFDLVSAGSSSPWHDVTLSLIACPVGTTAVTATFSGVTDSTGYYQNQGSAGNIQLQVQDAEGVSLNSGAEKTIAVDEATQSASFPLQIRALSVNGNATQGSIQAVINITYTYA
ncbi:fimbrial protein [Samsonia erythrinae]|uniref:Minor fimbrial subunit n=1 Tax=Samsonia erythrinae TaxID=160434 RepID=A0A4R3VLH9_9GAMM|nr:fimbrial protein [Samsonia erythrinae]TCV04752.1 minor fimbrial subunit [Samsonia erythrinae]